MKNPIGMHYGYWSHNWDEIEYIPLIEKVHRLGFDICEVASAEFAYFSDDKLRELKQCADDNNIGFTYSIGLEGKYDLASDDASFVTASNFLVDGGLTGAYVTPL